MIAILGTVCTLLWAAALISLARGGNALPFLLLALVFLLVLIGIAVSKPSKPQPPVHPKPSVSHLRPSAAEADLLASHPLYVLQSTHDPQCAIYTANLPDGDGLPCNCYARFLPHLRPSAKSADPSLLDRAAKSAPFRDTDEGCLFLEAFRSIFYLPYSYEDLAECPDGYYWSGAQVVYVSIQRGSEPPTIYVDGVHEPTFDADRTFHGPIPTPEHLAS